ncbi:murein transglycosylase A [Rhodoferax sp. U2-2l]|uniref:murein transglycosylase A n=1 Tax=Rhodoferax sp. U2-2l TaxID=2884000 RepID=UPI00351D93B9
MAALALALLGACGSVPVSAPGTGAPQALPAPVGGAPATGVTPVDAGVAGPVLTQRNSRWVPVSWAELPGLNGDALFEAWNAWLKSCERPGVVFAPLCPEVRRLSIGDAAAQRDWLQSRLQPYRVEPLQGGSASGLLTAYFEPEMLARRQPGEGFTTPLYLAPDGLIPGKPWFTRREADTLAPAQAALRGRELLYLADPVDAMLLQIQGSGRLRVTEPDGRQRLVRLAYAGHNGQPYQSIGRWLLDQGELRDASWPGIRAWISRNPQRVTELLWQNPRLVFFKEEALGDFDAGFGPRGAQGVPLTPGRSIAVDPQSIPYGTPVWLASEGPQLTLQKLVLAQDTGSAIVGAVRADYFVGWGAQAGELAGRLKQPLRLWVLWPKAQQ